MDDDAAPDASPPSDDERWAQIVAEHKREEPAFLERPHDHPFRKTFRVEAVAAGLLALWALWAAPRRSFLESVHLLRAPLATLYREPSAPQALASLLRYLSAVTRDAPEVVPEVIAQLPAPSREDATHYDQLLVQEGLEEGKAIGLKEGQAIGLKEGQATLVLRLLRRRFRELPREVEARVHGATIEELERWAERLLDAQALEEVFA